LGPSKVGDGGVRNVCPENKSNAGNKETWEQEMKGGGSVVLDVGKFLRVIKMGWAHQNLGFLKRLKGRKGKR